MLIEEYPRATSLLEGNIFLIDGPEGTKTITVTDAILSVLHLMSPDNHRKVFRGKSLGTSVTAAQKAVIAAGTFDDIWLGDYWEINGYKWRVVDFDYWYNTGDTLCNKHHVVLMPDTYLYAAKMNSIAIATGAYVGSEMYTTNLNQAKTMINNAFGGNLLTHRDYLTNAIVEDHAAYGAWYDSTVELPNEIMILGSYINASCGPEAKRYTINKTQLALFSATYKYLNTGSSFWLRDVVNSTQFATVGYYSSAGPQNANGEYGVRPVFAIC